MIIDLDRSRAPCAGAEGIDVSVVIVSYQCVGHLRRCLERLPAALTGTTWEVIVVDNASTDGTLEWLRHEHPAVTAVSLPRNVGFARANNTGFAIAKGRHVLVLNPDTLPDSGSIASLVAVLDASPGAGVVAPALVNTDGSDQRTARRFPTAAAFVFGRRSPLTRWFPKNRWSTRYLRTTQSSPSDRPYAVDWVSGACMLVPAAVIARVGGFDPAFFMYWEDADWCRRMKTAGLTVLVTPWARVVHHEGGSTNGWPRRQVIVFHTSVFRYWKKHARPIERILLQAPLAAALACRATALVALPLIRRGRRLPDEVTSAFPAPGLPS